MDHEFRKAGMGGIIACMTCLSLCLLVTAAQPASVKRPLNHHRPHWGVPPGYRPPVQSYVDPERATYPWYGGPGFYAGRWNGGGFGPCWTKTPIGPVWNCGR